MPDLCQTQLPLRVPQSLDKALVAWGVKSPPGEPEIDFKEKIKSAGLAGALAYGGTELAFWIISVPLAVVGYHQTTGEWLDLTSLEGKEKASLVGLIDSVPYMHEEEHWVGKVAVPPPQRHGVGEKATFGLILPIHGMKSHGNHGFA